MTETKIAPVVRTYAQMPVDAGYIVYSYIKNKKRLSYLWKDNKEIQGDMTVLVQNDGSCQWGGTFGQQAKRDKIDINYCWAKEILLGYLELQRKRFLKFRKESFARVQTTSTRSGKMWKLPWWGSNEPMSYFMALWVKRKCNEKEDINWCNFSGCEKLLPSWVLNVKSKLQYSIIGKSREIENWVLICLWFEFVKVELRKGCVENSK